MLVRDGNAIFFDIFHTGTPAVKMENTYGSILEPDTIWDAFYAFRADEPQSVSERDKKPACVTDPVFSQKTIQ